MTIEFTEVLDFLNERGYIVRDYSESAGTESLWIQYPPTRGFRQISKRELIKVAYNLAAKEVYGRENQSFQGGLRESS